MNSNIFQWRSLKTRVTLFTLAIFLIGIWSLAFYASRMLREDMQRLLGEQQFSTVSFIAADVNHEVNDRLRALETMAGIVSPAMLGNTAALQAFLEQQPIVQVLFNGGLIAYRLDGTAIADFPLSAGRIGINHMDRDFLVAALKEGKSTIGRPVMGRKLQSPVFPMAVPIRDTQGKVIGALSGVTDLGKPNFLDEITQGRYGKTGGYILVAPQQRLIVTASDKSRIMRALPVAGISPMIERFIQGYEGSAVYVNPLGVEVLASAKGIPVAGWYVLAALPTAEAFAQIHAMQQRMLLAAIILTLLAGGLTSWMLRRQLAPMLSTIKTLATLSDTNQLQQPLPIARQDEIGELIGGFNRLLETLAQREETLKESEFRWKFAIEGSGDGLWDWNVAVGTVFFTRRWKEMLGFADDEIGNGLEEWEKRIHPADKSDALATVQDHLDGKTPIYVSEHRLRCKDGGYKCILDRGMVVSRGEDGKPLRMIGTQTDITVRKQAEAALRESEERYRALAEWSPEAIAVHRGGKWIYANLAALKMIGATSAQELIGKPILDLVHPDFHQIVLARLKNLADHGVGAPMIEMRLLKLDGTAIDVEAQATSIVYDGAPAVHAAIRDITVRKQAELELRESEARFHSLTDLSSDWYWEQDRELRLSFHSIGFEQRSGTMSDKLLGKRHWEEPSRYPLRGTWDEHRATLEARKPFRDFEYVKIGDDGEQYFVSLSGVPIYDAAGKFTGYRGVGRNITERKRAEVEVRTLSRAMEQNPASIVITDQTGTIGYVNPRFEQVTGYTKAEAVGSNSRILKSGKTAAEVYEQLWAVISVGGEWRGELCNRRKNGELFWEFVAISGIRGENGEIEHYIAVKEDITERKRMEAAHAQLEAQLREAQKMEAIGTLAGGIAHDFNHIIAAILGNAELARQDLSANPLALESLEEIRKAGARARDLVQQILSFSRKQPTKRK
ncbi:MAG: PAS domain S-box protein, partial [Betaproteobacteria bacterium]|nr:PAS domain S-box protein [Betaproteobacteria bacterium]